MPTYRRVARGPCDHGSACTLSLAAVPRAGPARKGMTWPVAYRGPEGLGRAREPPRVSLLGGGRSRSEMRASWTSLMWLWPGPSSSVARSS